MSKFHVIALDEATDKGGDRVVTTDEKAQAMFAALACSVVNDEQHFSVITQIGNDVVKVGQFHRGIAEGYKHGASHGNPGGIGMATLAIGGLLAWGAYENMRRT